MVAILRLEKRTSLLFGGDETGGYRREENVGDGLNGSAIFIPPTGQGTSAGTVGIYPGEGASGKAQVTLDTYDSIKSGDAEWVDWDKGTVSAGAIAIFNGPVSAVRGVSITGNVRIVVLV